MIFVDSRLDRPFFTAQTLSYFQYQTLSLQVFRRPRDSIYASILCAKEWHPYQHCP